jgi:hypothetical protein
MTDNDMTEYSTESVIFDPDDGFDIRDVIARVEHLEKLRQPGRVDLGYEDNETAQDDLLAELAKLEGLLSEVCGQGGDHEWRGDWYPVTFIPDRDFVSYAKELAEDIGAVNSSLGWPYGCIDWEAAAEELRTDYASVEFDGDTYWYR